MITIAWAALILWPVAAIVFYQKMSLPVALCATIVGGYLLLPVDVGLDLPVLPPFNKFTIPSLSALFLTVIAVNRAGRTYPVLPGWLPRDPVPLGFLAVLVVGAFGSVYTNGDTLIYGERVIRGLSPYDGFSSVLELGMLLLPLLLARKVLASPQGQWILLLSLVLSAIAYSFLTLYEVRMSPQLHADLYGFFPHSFSQHVRQGGFRPLVFLHHGLALSIFLSFSVIAAAGLFRITKDQDRWKWALALIWLLITLVLSKSLGALLIVIVLLPITLFLRPRTQLLVGTCIAGMVMTYPVLRTAQLVPVDQIMSLAESINPERAASLYTRIQNEDVLLEKARERPLFGWAGWGRNRVYAEDGRDISITDGSWIIALGLGGWFRYIPLFGLLCWPVIGLFLAKRDRIDPVCAILTLVLCVKLVDLIPNGAALPITWLVAGSLLGRLEMKLSDVRGEAPATVTGDPARKLAYGRSGPATARTSERAVRYARKFPGRDEKTETPAGGTAERKPQDDLSYTRAKQTTRYRQ